MIPTSLRRRVWNAFALSVFQTNINSYGQRRAGMRDTGPDEHAKPVWA
jgi:hypothetical protein